MRTSNNLGPIIRTASERILAVAFFVSGIAGLVFEVVWFYRCGLAFGSSLWATAIVLSSFMGGLALGNASVALYGYRLQRFLLAYAALEISVAVSGVALTYAIPSLTRLLAFATRIFVDAVWVINFVRWITCFAALLLPATAMGATLPLLVAALHARQSRFGAAMGRLYGWNTLGAMVGVVGAEVVLIPRFGVMGAAWIAALLDSVAATAAFWIAPKNNRLPSAEPHAATRPAGFGTVSWRPIAVAALLAGCALLALEVVWFRLLSMLVANNTLALSLILATVLAAIGFGALAGSRLLVQRLDVLAYLPAVAFVTACLLIASYWTFPFVTGHSRALDWYRILWFASWLCFPTSLGSGILFTLLTAAARRSIDADTKAAGSLLLANTAGATFGSPLAAFVLLPMFGTERSLLALAILYVAIGALTIRVTPQWKTAFRATWTAGLASALVIVSFPSGLMLRTYFARALEPHIADGSEVIAIREGPAETIFLTRQKWRNEPIYYRLVTNGISMSATTLKAKRYMRLFAYLPMLIHKSPLRRVLVIGYGVGVTAAAATDVRSAESIDIVEISRDITAMSDVIYSASTHPLRNPRVHVHIEDGRYFLQTTNDVFDLITGEPPPPLTPGAVNIYTREYFQLMHRRLAEGGIATYWLPVARLAGTDHAAIIRAFCDVFEDCSLWNGTPADLMLMGTRGAVGPIADSQFTSAWNDPVLAVRMREVGFEQPEQIGAAFIGDGEYVRGLTAGSLTLTDDYPRRVGVPPGTSLTDPRRRLDWSGSAFYRDVIDARRAKGAFATSPIVRRLWPAMLKNTTLQFFDVQRIVNRVLTDGPSPLNEIADLHSVLTRTSLTTLPRWLLGLDDIVLAHLNELPNDGSGQVEYLFGLRALTVRDYVEAVTYFGESADRGLRDARPLLVYSLCLAGKFAPASARIRSLEVFRPDQRQFLDWLHATFGIGPGPA